MEHRDAGPSASTTRSAGSSRRSSALSTLPCTPTTGGPIASSSRSTVDGREVAGVKQQVRRRDPLDARLRQPPRPARQMRVGYHGDQHARTTLVFPAPVAQWIERCPPEAEVAGSNPAGRTSLRPPRSCAGVRCRYGYLRTSLGYARSLYRAQTSDMNQSEPDFAQTVALANGRVLRVVADAPDSVRLEEWQADTAPPTAWCSPTATCTASGTRWSRRFAARAFAKFATRTSQIPCAAPCDAPRGTA